MSSLHEYANKTCFLATLLVKSARITADIMVTPWDLNVFSYVVAVLHSFVVLMIVSS